LRGNCLRAQERWPEHRQLGAQQRKARIDDLNGFLHRADELAQELLADGIAEASDMITGQNINIDGGW
jgi:hypothetical protein